jgi:acyl dehydratase
MRFFDDFSPGILGTYGPVAVTKDDIVAFAREFDPQPFHIDEEAAQASFAGGLIASGWHTCALAMRMIAQGFLLEAASLGAPGIEEVQWLRPVRPGDTLRIRVSVLETRGSERRPAIGLVRFEIDVLNGADEPVMRQRNWIMFGRRGHPWPPAPGQGPPAAGETAPPVPPPAPVPPPFLDELREGDTSDLGAFTFTADEIVRFARAFDMQPFHIDPEAARHSLFGGLCASGWHTAAIWMKLMIAHRETSLAEAARRGLDAPLLGPSPGFKALKWSRPVFAGDTIAYRSTIAGTRPSASRPGWGLAFHRNTGVNQRGEEVFAFDGAVFWERRPD